MGLALLGGTAWCSVARAQLLKDELPANAQGVTVVDRVGEFVPLDLVFTDERGNQVSLGTFFKRGKPVILTLNYSDCPGLCIAQLDNLVGTLRELPDDWLGARFEIVTVSIDPTETTDKALRTKAKYMGLLGRDAGESWHFLTGRYQNIQRLADAVGFRFRYDQANRRYNHPAATYFLSQDGRICRCLVSLGVEPDQFRMAVSEASEGKLTIGGLADAFIQLCYYYDPDANRYTASARRIMAFGGFAFCLLLLGATAPFWFAGRRRPDVDGQGLAAERDAAANGHVDDDGHGGPADGAYNSTQADSVSISGPGVPGESDVGK
ncbi:MAG: SCO family protein [Planctomycetota bacterium]|nr:MAG: SCO family protein [Planctomycetota bacterium]